MDENKLKKRVKKLKADTLIDNILKYNSKSINYQKDSGNKTIFNIVIEELLDRKNNRLVNEEELKKLFDGLIEKGIKYKEVLHFYIRCFLGFYIPRYSHCKHKEENLSHTSPFEFISDMFFEKVVNAIAFANRTGGKTLSIAILNHLDMTFKKKCEVCTAGAVLKQATRSQEYLRDFHYQNDSFLAKQLLDSDPTKWRIFYKNGSETEIITASYDGLNGPHPQKARIDEIELIKGGWETLQQAFSMTLPKENILEQTVYSSTRKFGDAVMQRLLNKSDDHNRDFPPKITPYLWKIYKWCIWETVEKCTRQCKDDSKYGSCPAYSKCKGKAHKVKGGWYPIKGFISKVSTMDTDTWNTEWLNKKPTGSVFVYGDYWDKDFHIIERENNKIALLEKEIYYVGGIDFGTSPGHDWVFKGYILDVEKFKLEVEQQDDSEKPIISKIKFYLDYEYRRSGKDTLEKHVKGVKVWEHYFNGIPIFADPAAARDRIELEALGVPTIEAVNAIGSGISLVKSHLQNISGEAYYYILDGYYDNDNPTLLSTDLEFDRYRYPKTKDGHVDKKIPFDKWNHGMDVDRYVIQSAIPYFREAFTIYWEEIVDGGFLFGGEEY